MARAIPEGHRIEHRERERGLAEVKEDRLREALLAERGQCDGIGEVDRIDGADGEEKASLRRAVERQPAGECPGNEHEWNRDEAGRKWNLPGRR